MKKSVKQQILEENQHKEKNLTFSVKEAKVSIIFRTNNFLLQTQKSIVKQHILEAHLTMAMLRMHQSNLRMSTSGFARGNYWSEKLSMLLLPLLRMSVFFLSVDPVPIFAA